MGEKKAKLGARFLERFGIVEMILYLNKSKEGVKKVDYRKLLKLGPQTSIKNNEVLFDLGLIENMPSTTELLFTLTDKGKKIASRLAEIDEILKM